MEDVEAKTTNVNQKAMAEEYLKNKNYTPACFMFIRDIKIKSAKKTGVMSDLDDIEKLLSASGANLSKEEVKKLKEILEKIIERGQASKEDCLFAKKISESL